MLSARRDKRSTSDVGVGDVLRRKLPRLFGVFLKQQAATAADMFLRIILQLLEIVDRAEDMNYVSPYTNSAKRKAKNDLLLLDDNYRPLLLMARSYVRSDVFIPKKQRRPRWWSACQFAYRARPEFNPQDISQHACGLCRCRHR